ncbi:MAG TPA: zinc ribbon domain-containing protein [Gemmatimonadales bacterium]|nr:zinc ribbon domain-containing protein [Gemmatimonadales bacterium]
MVLEVVGALLIGALVLWLVFSPMLSRAQSARLPPEPVADEETRSGIALLALKEIEFDRATGKLSDEDFEMLRERYGKEALSALDQDDGQAEAASADPETMIAARLQQLRSARDAGATAPPPCPACGPRPEPDALFCSSCGLSLSPAFCVSCGTALEAGSRFCPSCGNRIAA